MKVELKSQFLLDPEITYLNHGSFGACPQPIFEDYQNWQRILEKEPVQFITKLGPQYLEKSKKALADYINCDPDDLIYVTNPSTAFNIIIRSLKLNEGDEILTTNQEYGAMDKTWKYYCEKRGAKYINQKISLPLQSKESFLEEFWKGLTSKTKVVFMSQITSPTGLIFPVQEVCERAKELGLLTIIDGAHVPAHIPLDLSKLKADIYTGACHKWMLTPKGNSFLFVKKEYQNDFDPLIISWGYEPEIPGKSNYLDYHEYQGTRDFSAFLTTPRAIQFLNDNDWINISTRCKKMIRENYGEACRLLNTEPLSPITDEFLGQLCSTRIKTSDPIKIKELLYSKYKIEIPIAKMGEELFLRISIQAYNSQDDIDSLFRAIREIQKNTSLLE